MTNETVTLDRELVERVADEANHMLGFTYAANYDTCRAAVDELRAALAEPVPPAGGEPEAVVAGWLRHEEDRGFIFTRSKSSAFAEPLYLHPTAYRMPSTEQAHVTRLQAEVRLLNHDVASYLETAAKTCDLLGIDLEAAKTAEGKPSDVLYRHAMALQSELTKAQEDLSTANDKLRRQDIASQYKDGQLSKHDGELAMLQAELTKARELLDTLRHAVWHALDDSEENAQTGEVTLSRYDFDELSTLVPEEWHDAYHNQSAQAAKGDGLSGTFSISPQQQEAQITVTDLRGVAPWEPAPVAVAPDLAELREYHANAVKDLEHYADDSGLRESDVKHYRKRAEFHRQQVALLDSLK